MSTTTATGAGSSVRGPQLQRSDFSAVWDDVLRAYESVLDEQRSYLLNLGPDDLVDRASVALPKFIPSAALPPMPASHLSWAKALLRDTEGLAGLAADLLEGVPAPAVPRPRRPSAMSASTLDRTL